MTAGGALPDEGVLLIDEGLYDKWVSLSPGSDFTTWGTSRG